MASLCMQQNSFQQFPGLNEQLRSLQENHYNILSNNNNNLSNIGANAANKQSIVKSKKNLCVIGAPSGEQLPSVARRNARERNRVKQVNNGFTNLRQHIPQTVINSLSNGGRGANKKLSKVDTLRIAVEYIKGLQTMLDQAKKISKRNTMDESSNDGSFDYSSNGSPQYQPRYAFNFDASSSPSPSFTDSDTSMHCYNNFQQIKNEQSFDGEYENQNPDDEDLLDYISSWQEQ